MKIRNLFLLCAFSLCSLASCDFGPKYIDITNTNDFKNMKCDGNYRLKCDLDFQGAKITPIGTRETPFTGRFLGDNHNISNYVIDSNDNAGLFGFVSGSISNVRVVGNIDMSSQEYTSAGLLVGISDGAKINDCVAAGNINITTFSLETASNVGGLIGYARKSDISRCYSSVNITVNSTASVYIGGLVGYNGGEKALESKVSYSYARNATLEGRVNNTKAACYVGGVVGKNYGTIDKCLSHHLEIKSHSDKFNVFAGGVVADNNDGLIANCLGASNITTTHEEGGVTYRGLALGRTFSSDVYKERGLAINNFASSIATYNNDDKASSIEHMTSDIAYLNDMKSSDWYKNTLKYDDNFKYLNGYYPSLYEDYIEIDGTILKGSPEDPIEISKIDDFNSIEMDKSYILKNDIDFNDNSINPIGTYQKPYHGVFNGNHKMLKQLRITRTSDINEIQSFGLFGFLNGTVKI